MLAPVTVHARRLEDYRDVVLPGVIERLRQDAQGLIGARVLHINATAYGGGVAEILSSMVPLMRDLGILAEWKVLSGTDEFFTVTKALHNALQGQPHHWTDEERRIWIEQNRANLEGWQETNSYDYIFVHDPQPAPLLGLLRDQGRDSHARWIWRCHLDLTDAQPEAWEVLRPYVVQYNGTIWTMRQFVREGMPEHHLKIAPPAIDPLSPKNDDLDDEVVSEVLKRFEVDPTRPIISQTSRFDPWKDPLGVIDAYRIAKQRHPGLQLVLVASMAHDDPEAWHWYERVLRHAGEDWDVRVLSNLNGVGHTEVNAFQRASSVVLQKSLREGFGLVVSEALWKGVAVIGGNAGGIPLQIQDGHNGYLVDSIEECASRLSELLDDPERARAMGEAGREDVRARFLITRYLADYVAMMNEVAGIPAGD